MAEIFNSVLTASLWGGCFTVLFILVNRLLKNCLAVSWHYYIWLAVIVRLLVPAFIPVSIEPRQVAAINQSGTVMQTEAAANTVPAIEVWENIAVVADAVAGNQAKLPEDVSVNELEQVSQVSGLWVIWFVIAVILASTKLVSYLAYRSKLKAECILPGEDEVAVFSRQKERLGVKSNIALIKYKGAQVPFAIGLFNLTVVLPDKEYSDTQLSYIFRHELTHIKSRDLIVKWLYEAAKIVHWFNPFVYIAAKNAAFYCELSCDAAILKNSVASERKEYGMMIVNLIEQAVKPKTPICVSMYSSKANLKNRMQCILDSGGIKRNIGISVTIAALTLALCACSSVQLQDAAPSEPDARSEEAIGELADESVGESEDGRVPAKTKTNLLIAGVDNGGDASRADTIIIASFDATTNQINMLPIPRDTYLSPSEETASDLKRLGVEIPNEIKFGEVTAYAKAHGMEYLQKEIKNSFGIAIDYYVKIDTSAFQRMVDAVGGVDMTIPEGGLYYNDPSQGLEIAIDGGKQHLDGEQAMKLARYRNTYKDGDLGRVAVQQQLLKALYAEVIDSDNLIEDSIALASLLIESAETNLTLMDVTPYLKYAPKLDAESIITLQLPVESGMKNGRSYVFANDAMLEGEQPEASILGVFK